MRIAGYEGTKLQPAQPNSWSVGDRCYLLDANGPGNRIIQEDDIVGQNTFSGAGSRLNLEHAPSREGMGSALLNEYGEFLGVVGGSLVPGINSLEGLRYGYPNNLLAVKGIYQGSMATPLDQIAIPAPDAPATTLEELARTGAFLPPLLGREDVNYATMTLEVQNEHGMLRPAGDKFELSKTEGHAIVFLNFLAQKRRKGDIAVMVYSLDNQLVEKSLPSKIDIPATRLLFWSQQLTLSGFVPAIYRVDVVIDGQPVWRTFFQVRD
ncbi:MAG: hypothetical protein ACRD50_08745 [Candidatus Acidiferrales bacterium]